MGVFGGMARVSNGVCTTEGRDIRFRQARVRRLAENKRPPARKPAGTADAVDAPSTRQWSNTVRHAIGHPSNASENARCLPCGVAFVSVALEKGIWWQCGLNLNARMKLCPVTKRPSATTNAVNGLSAFRYLAPRFTNSSSVKIGTCLSSLASRSSSFEPSQRPVGRFICGYFGVLVTTTRIFFFMVTRSAATGTIRGLPAAWFFAEAALGRGELGRRTGAPRTR